MDHDDMDYWAVNMGFATNLCAKLSCGKSEHHIWDSLLSAKLQLVHCILEILIILILMTVHLSEAVVNAMVVGVCTGTNSKSGWD